MVGVPSGLRQRFKAYLESGGDLIDAKFGDLTSSGSAVLRDTSEASAAPGFGAWTEVSADRPSLVIIDASATTDGAADGQVDVQVDQSGDQAADYTTSVVADLDGGAGFSARETQTVYLPPGGHYQIANTTDPSAANAINNVRHVTL